MTKSSRALLYYLAQYVGTNNGRRQALCALHKKRTGQVLNPGNLSRHLALQNQPLMDTTLVYISFLHEAGELTAGKPGEGIFFFTHPEWLRAKSR